MNYKIIEIHAVYTQGKLSELAVLWESNSNGWVRASYATSKPCYGYKFLMPGETISDKLIQDVAGTGANLPDAKKTKYFPGKRSWER